MFHIINTKSSHTTLGKYTKPTLPFINIIRLVVIMNPYSDVYEYYLNLFNLDDKYVPWLFKVLD